MGVVGQPHAPAALLPGKKLLPLYVHTVYYSSLMMGHFCAFTCLVITYFVSYSWFRTAYLSVLSKFCTYTSIWKLLNLMIVFQTWRTCLSRLPTILNWGYQVGVITGLFQVFCFHSHSHICHFRFKFIHKSNEGYTGMTIQVSLCPRPSIINALIPDQEVGLEGLPRFVCPLPEIVGTHILTRPTGRIYHASCHTFNP